jgi:large subunit ribosomal protein L25
MGKELKLEAQARADEKNKDLRKSGFIPAVVYGAGQETTNLKLKLQDFKKVFAIAGESTLINLSLDGKDAVKVIVKSIQKDAVKDEIIHVDFYAIDMKKKIEVEIPLNFIGESKAVKELGGTLITNMETVHVQCLPGDLVESLDIDLSILEDFSNTLRVADVKSPETIEITNDENQTVATVAMPRTAKQIEEMEKEERGETESEEEKEAREEGEAPAEEQKSK